MATTSTFSGSILPTVLTQHIVGTISTSGVYIFATDLSNLTLGDGVELRAIGSAGAGTIGALYDVAYDHIQSTQIKISPPIPVIRPTMFSIRQSSGTQRWIFFEVISV